MKHSRNLLLLVGIFSLLAFLPGTGTSQKPKPTLIRIGKVASVTVSGGDTPPGMSASQTLRWEGFTKVWQTLDDNYFDRTFNGLDWNKIKAEYRPRVIAAKTDGELYTILNEMIQRLGRSHFAIMPPEYLNTLKAAKRSSKLKERKMSGIDSDKADDLDESDLSEEDEIDDSLSRYGVGLDMRLIDDRFVVTYIESGSAAERSGIKPGFIVDKINGVSISAIVDQYVKLYPNLRNLKRYLPIQIASWFLNGEKDSAVTVTCLDSADLPKDFTMTRQRLIGESVSLGSNYPSQFVRYESRSISDEIGYIKFNLFSFDMIDKVCNSLSEFKTKRAVIVDLRGNLGGLIASLIGVSGMFTDRPIEIGTTITRGSSQPLSITPKKKHFTGRLVFLVDNQTVSAAELFAAGMQENDRVLVVGSTTAGEALPASAIQLATGATFLYPIANFKTRKGNFLEGNGLVPNFAVAMDRTSLLAGTDPQLERGLSLIRENRDFPIQASLAEPTPLNGGAPPPPPPARIPKPELKNGINTSSNTTFPPMVRLPSTKLSKIKDAKSLEIISDYLGIIGEFKELKTYDAVGSGTLSVEGTSAPVGYHLSREMPEKYLFTITTAAAGDVRQIHSSDLAVVESDFGYEQTLPAFMDAKRADVFGPIAIVSDINNFDSLKYLGAFDRQGRRCHIVEGTIGAVTVAMTFDVEKRILVSYAGTGGPPISYGDYKKSGNLTLPFQVEIEGVYKIQFSQIKIDQILDASIFKKKEKCFDKPL